MNMASRTERNCYRGGLDERPRPEAESARGVYMRVDVMHRM